jgi:hypothetical protein
MIQKTFFWSPEFQINQVLLYLVHNHTLQDVESGKHAVCSYCIQHPDTECTGTDTSKD